VESPPPPPEDTSVTEMTTLTREMIARRTVMRLLRKSARFLSVSVLRFILPIMAISSPTTSWKVRIIINIVC